MELKNRIEAFAELGSILEDGLAGKGKFAGQLNSIIDKHHITNPWFTPGNVTMAVQALAQELTAGNLTEWTSRYPFIAKYDGDKTVAVIMAGNIPAAGFHDMLSVLIAGKKLQAKLSSKDSDLITLFTEILININSDFSQLIELTDGTLKGFDSVIATGSDNSARYFDYYFSKYPHIIRKNRNSIAIISGDETRKDLEDLGTDIFSYFGLGCRSVSKIYIPEGYEIDRLTEGLKKFEDVISNSKYANNYDFNKAVYLVNKEKFSDTGYLLLKKDLRLSSPVAVLYYDYYKDVKDIKILTEDLKDKIQCIAGKNFLPFGSTQYPHLWDYADGVDTLRFLSEKKMSGNIL